MILQVWYVTCFVDVVSDNANGHGAARDNAINESDDKRTLL